jgi:hypothetical protein
MSKSKTIKRLFEIVSNMNEMDIQAVVGLAERLYITSGENYVK